MNHRWLNRSNCMKASILTQAAKTARKPRRVRKRKRERMSQWILLHFRLLISQIHTLQRGLKTKKILLKEMILNSRNGFLINYCLMLLILTQRNKLIQNLIFKSRLYSLTIAFLQWKPISNLENSNQSKRLMLNSKTNLQCGNYQGMMIRAVQEEVSLTLRWTY